ncbi:MAG: hypothetical protein IM600_14010 [Bacteroidetes bacterium]|nr:hypothetical protein [Bacteroidota bacterium]MCA6444542.1 hypothetical protein [Bacteroidota bacterium]
MFRFKQKIEIVYGYTFAALINFESGEYFSIPNLLLKSFVSNLNNEVETKNHPIFDFLTRKKLIFQTDLKNIKKNQTVDISKPNYLNNAVIRARDKVMTDINSIICLGVETFFIVIDSETDIISLNCKLAKQHIKSIYFINYLIEYDTLKEIININQNIICVYIVIKDSKEDFAIDGVPISYVNSKFEDQIFDLTVNEFNFAITEQNYYESKKVNSYFYKNIYVDKNGFINNTPNLNGIDININSFNNIQEFITVILSSEFTKYWFIPKSEIQVCKDCEFNRICVDKRIPIVNGKESYYKSECNYNPYIAKWKGDIAYLSLLECGIEFIDGEGYRFDRKKIKKQIKEIWGF